MMLLLQVRRRAPGRSLSYFEYGQVLIEKQSSFYFLISFSERIA